ncbi:hypothetical protein [Hippea alviniae]|uniref:hypothetical protein n=1 Tax=Hippea alviniae TaxID=1279027 RepID=UPI0003B3D2BB|nr:hypothetical protein [Hippea alviniae]
MGYQKDRKFTEYIHKKIALKKIYEPLNWEKIKVDKKEIEKIDINKGIDRIFKNSEDNLITVQERFRSKEYENYNDFTIRYTREKNIHHNRRKSEFFKIEADYFVYGITNCNKDKINFNCNDFIKFAVIDMKIIKELIDKGIIIIDENSQKKESFLKNGKLITPILKNKDDSSEFIALSIPDLNKLDKRAVIFQKGFEYV